MSEKNETGIPQTPEIFGESKSREQIKAEARAEKKAQRVAEKEEAARLRALKKEMPKEKRTDILVVVGILVGIVLVCTALLFVQMYIERFDQDLSRENYFLDTDAESNLNLETGRITAAVQEAYYTKGGYLAVKMVLGNGADFDLNLLDISVELRNGDNEAVIASGRVDGVSKEFVIPVGGKKLYTMYIKPEHITIHDDPLSTISYTITANGEKAETSGSTAAAGSTSGAESADTTTTAAPATTTAA